MVAAAVLAGGCARPLAYRTPPAASDGRVALGLVHAGVAAALREAYGARGTQGPPPVALVAADGGALELRALTAKATIEGPLAQTELRLTFHNPEPHERAGRFSLALPPDAVVTSLAVRTDGGWRESQVVSRSDALSADELYLRREAPYAASLGHQLSVSRLPIGPASDREILIAYDHQVSAVRPYRLALAGLPAVLAVRVSIDHDGAERSYAWSGAVPEDVVVPIAPGSQAVTGGGAFLARIEGGAKPSSVALDRVLVLVDTSASRAALMRAQVDAVARVMAALPPKAEVVIAAFDHGAAEIYRGRAGDAEAGAVARALYERGALGASDLGAALAYAAASGMPRVVLIGDGRPTLGARGGARLAALVRGSSIARIDAVQVGVQLDRDTLAGVVAAGREPGTIIEAGAPELAHRLAITLPPAAPILVEHAGSSYPASTRGQVPGEPLWVAGAWQGRRSIAVQVGARPPLVLEPRPVSPVRVERAVAQLRLAAMIDELEAADGAARWELAQRIGSFAFEHRLVSPFTQLIVLDSDVEVLPVFTERALALHAPVRSLDDTPIRFTCCFENERLVPASEGRPPYTGELLAVMEALARGDRDGALVRAVRWQLAQPGDVIAVLALGEALEARGASALAARAYGSLLDRYSHRVHLLRVAGQRLDRVAATLPAVRALAIDAYRRALVEDETRVATYRLLALALLRAGRAEEALETLKRGMPYAQESARDVLAEDARVIAAHLSAAAPREAPSLAAQMGLEPAALPSLRIVSSFEDKQGVVDLHVEDRSGEVAPAVGRYGAIEQVIFAEPQAFPYRIGVRLSDAGTPLGLGTVQIFRHDGAGRISIEDRPFVIQRGGARADLGRVAGP